MTTVTSHISAALHQDQQGLHMQPHHAYTAQPAPYGHQQAYSQAPPPGYPTQQGPPAGYPAQQQQMPHLAHSSYPLQQHGRPQQHIQQAQQHQVGKQLVLASPQHVYPHAVDLVLREKFGLMSSDNFSIMDARTGAPMFRLDARLNSFSEKRALLDAYGRPVVQMHRKLMSLHGTWLMNTPAGVRIADVKPALMLTPSFKVYFNDGDDTADLIASGNFCARSFAISHKPRGGQERVVATVKKESCFANRESFFRNGMLDAQSYFLHVEPGVDVAFMAALATLIDEMFHDAN